MSEYVFETDTTPDVTVSEVGLLRAALSETTQQLADARALLELKATTDDYARQELLLAKREQQLAEARAQATHWNNEAQEAYRWRDQNAAMVVHLEAQLTEARALLVASEHAFGEIFEGDTNHAWTGLTDRLAAFLGRTEDA